MRLMTRIVVVIVAIALVALVGYILTGGEGTAAAAIRQWFIWIWRGFAESMIRLFGPIYEPTARFLSRTAQKTVVRRLMQPVFQTATIFLILVIIRLVGGKMEDKRTNIRKGKRILYPKLYWVRIRQYNLIRFFTRPLKRAWNWKPKAPRWIRASIALIATGLTFWLCVKVGPMFGDTLEGVVGSLAFAMIVFYIVEKAPAIGVDAVASIFFEQVAWVKDLRRKFEERWPKTYRFLKAVTGLAWLRNRLLGEKPNNHALNKPIASHQTKEAA